MYLKGMNLIEKSSCTELYVFFSILFDISTNVFE